jgi:Na+/proline symporter
MSSMDSGINSLSTVVVNDFVRPLRRAAASDESDLRIARILVVVFGVFATAVAFYATTIGEILKTAQIFLGLFSGPVLALFLLGILTRRGSFAAWLVGVGVAIPSTIAIQRWTEVHFVYYFPYSFGVCFVVGLALSLVFGRPTADRSLTLWGNASHGNQE